MGLTVQLLLVAVLCVVLTNADDLVVGTTTNLIGYSENVKLSSIPLKVRTKNVFYNSNNATRIIKGISAIDLDKSKARATITSGGIGQTYVNVKLKSKSGDRLYYVVQIFV